MHYRYRVREFLKEVFWWDRPLPEIERERRVLIEQRREAVRLHRPVADIDSKLAQLTKAALRKRKRIWARAA